MKSKVKAKKRPVIPEIVETFNNTTCDCQPNEQELVERAKNDVHLWEKELEFLESRVQTVKVTKLNCEKILATRLKALHNKVELFVNS